MSTVLFSLCNNFDSIERLLEARFLIITEVKGRKAEQSLLYWLEQKVLKATLQIRKLRPRAQEVSREHLLCARLCARFLVLDDLIQCLQEPFKKRAL